SPNSLTTHFSSSLFVSSLDLMFLLDLYLFGPDPMGRTQEASQLRRPLPFPDAEGPESPSGESTIARLRPLTTLFTSVIPNTRCNWSAGTFMGPAEGAVPGAG